ncbi:Ecm22 transcription factor [Candida orthopsilosis Co 90-125]|uniref:Ecm22 transcription factor n=1 Tax=Candida orthopsilosis (strain 90-125) TaxID=1136231 RepID=H8X4W0_CANO9|nr:Ecm22 transcription factor [Candida orthopsilosis Co 90-125]CCG23052.1 Ecm22 transcription factor [Candida orthopsilosis Co 90-125]
MTSESNSSENKTTTTGEGDNAFLERNIPRDKATDSVTKPRKISKSKSKSKLTPAPSNDSPRSVASSMAASRSQQEKQKRRKHKNSKLGCPNCKQRRVKCSEDLPSCANCIKHKVECGYLSYTKEEIEELKQAKLERQQVMSEQKLDSKSESDETDHQMGIDSNNASPLTDSGKNHGTRENKKKKASSSPKKIIKPKSKRTTSKTTQVSVQRHGKSFDNRSTTNSASNTSLTESYGNQFQSQDNVNHNPSEGMVIQNFDNLLGHDSGAENSIIFPIYRMHQNHTEHLSNNLNFPSEHSTAIPPNLPNTPTSILPPNALPGAIIRPTSILISRHRKHINYAKENNELFKKTNSGIIQGDMTLEPIRHVYWSWLKSFVYLGTSHPLRFYCLLNICANYLISNSFEDSYKMYSVGRARSPIERGKELAHMRQTCLVKTIHYYDQVIKRLRSMLASSGPDPDATCTVSYMLSLTSIYDPERSLYSTNCYREGLFDMLEYYNNLNVPIEKPSIVQIELKLMTNIMMTGNLPAYDSMFLTEARQMFIAFGEILFSLCEQGTLSLESDHPWVRTSQFLQLKYHQLLQFLNETIDVYIPQINDKITDLEVQQDLLYQMLTKWVIIFPSQLLFPTSSQGPLEKTMYLFYKFVKKALFAIFPHVKFFFLRNFDGPILLDVYASDDYTIYQELSQPPALKNDSSHYEPHVDQLKLIAAFLIRGSTYFRKRFAILYPILMRFIAMHDFQGSDINKWRKTIQNIAELREQFCEKMQVTEVNMKSFINGYVQKCNYPLPGSEIRAGIEGNSLTNDSAVDFTTLLPSGLLVGDYDPAFG